VAAKYAARMQFEGFGSVMRKKLSDMVHAGELFMCVSKLFASKNSGAVPLIKNSIFFILNYSCDEEVKYHTIDILSTAGRCKLWWSFDSDLQHHPNSYVSKIY
jgi:hypothetical protein